MAEHLRLTEKGRSVVEHWRALCEAEGIAWGTDTAWRLTNVPAEGPETRALELYRKACLESGAVPGESREPFGTHYRAEAAMLHALANYAPR